VSGRISAAERAALPVARAALEGRASAYGPADAIVFALGSAQLLQTPEAGAEVERLQKRVAELEREVVAAKAERDIEIVVWLGKKAREYRSTGGQQHRLQADAVDVMASKIARGAVRPAGTGGAS
jgi:hypothetical protein